MDRTAARLVWGSAAIMSLMLLASASGCGWLALAMYTISPDDIPAKFKGLQEKRVVVVCRPVAELQFADSTVPRDLTRQVSALLGSKVRKINLVDDREVSEWADENSWQSFTEVGKALKAEMVVGIELERFSLHQGPTLLQGNSAVQVSVYDMENGGRRVFEQPLPSVLYPTHMPIPASEKTEGQFRRQFLAVLAEQIARNFYAHDSRVDFASDAGL